MKLIYIFLSIFILSSCTMQPEGLETVASFSIARQPTSYFVQYGVDSVEELRYVVIFSGPINTTLGGIIATTHKDKKCFSRMELPDGTIINLPESQTQIYEYKDGVLHRANYRISLKEFNDYMESEKTAETYRFSMDDFRRAKPKQK